MFLAKGYFLFAFTCFSFFAFGSCLTCLQGTNNSLGTESTMLPSACSPGGDYACHRYDVYAEVTGVALNVSIGQCAPRASCEKVTCSALSSVLDQLSSGVSPHITGCCSACCYTDNCNSLLAKRINPTCNGSKNLVFSSWTVLMIFSLGALLSTTV